MGATFRSRDGVDLVDDHGLDAAERLPGCGGQHQIQRLGSGDEHIRRVAAQPVAVARRGVTGPHAHSDVGHAVAEPRRLLPDPRQRDAQVPLYIHPESLQRGNVDHPCAARPGTGLQQQVEGMKEGGESLPGTGGCHHQDMPTGTDRLPRPFLHRGRRGKGSYKPAARRRREARQSAATSVPSVDQLMWKEPSSSVRR